MADLSRQIAEEKRTQEMLARPLGLEMFLARECMRYGQIELLSRMPTDPRLRSDIEDKMLPVELFNYDSAATMYQHDPAFRAAVSVVRQVLAAAEAARAERDEEILDGIRMIQSFCGDAEPARGMRNILLVCKRIQRLMGGSE